MTNIELARVHYIPKSLEPGMLYVSEEFGAAVHLCACGCGMKVSTPLRPTGWTLEESEGGPTLYPSVGNWQFPCKSHYWIRCGRIVWCEAWSSEMVATGRNTEDEERRAYYNGLDRKQVGIFQRIWNWIKSMFQ